MLHPGGMRRETGMGAIEEMIELLSSWSGVGASCERPEPKMPTLTTLDRPWSEYPAGTKAHAFNGGAWLKLHNGRWQWNGHTSSPGGSFPTPGADAFGVCVELPVQPGTAE